jgi:isopropylmalate/homocitrate/citramalate synthase
MTAAGIHVDGMMKDPEIYNIFDTEALLHRPVGVKINDKSGAAGIAYWVNQHLRLPVDRQVDKKHPAVLTIAAWVDAQYRQGRTTAIASEEMVEQIAQHLADYVNQAEPKLAVLPA